MRITSLSSKSITGMSFGQSFVLYESRLRLSMLRLEHKIEEREIDR